MKKSTLLFIVIIICLCMITACRKKDSESGKEDFHDYGKIFYVSPNGNDFADGTKESPLATIDGAIKKLHEYKAQNGLPEGGIKIEFASGVYNVRSANIILPEDSGEEGKPIVFAAADGAEVVFEGGVILNPADFVPADDDFKSRLQTEEAKQNVVSIDLEVAGAYDLDDSREYDLGCKNGDGAVEISEFRQTFYANNRMQRVAKWPNGDMTVKIHGELAGKFNGEYSSFYIPDEKTVLWKDEKQLCFNGNPYNNFRQVFDWHPIINSSESTISVAWDYGNNDTFYVFNAACELDEPGEYYWDVESKKLYYWPENGFDTAKLAFSQYIGGDFFSLSGASYLIFDGLTFENFRTRAFFGENVRNITISNCRFYCMGPQCVRFFGDNIVISHNVFEESMGNTVFINGGNRDLLDVSNILITDNVFLRFCNLYNVGNSGLFIHGYGYYIAHNLFEDSFTGAIGDHSANSLLEYNIFNNLNYLGNDAGAIYNGDKLNCHSLYRYNCFTNCGSNGIYLDDCLSDIVCYGNILADIKGKAFALGGGRSVTVFNNVLVNTGGIGFDERGVEWYPTITSYPDGELWSGTESNVILNFLDSLWRYANPYLLSSLEMKTIEELKFLKGIVSEHLDSPGPPSYANIYSNIGFNSDGRCSSDVSDYVFNRTHYLIFNRFEEDTAEPEPKVVQSVYRFGSIHDNIEYTSGQNDIFEDYESGNFFLKEDSRVYRDIIGFEKWDYNLLGIQK